MLSINGLERPIAIYLYGRKMYEMLGDTGRGGIGRLWRSRLRGTGSGIGRR